MKVGGLMMERLGQASPAQGLHVSITDMARLRAVATDLLRERPDIKARILNARNPQAEIRKLIMTGVISLPKLLVRGEMPRPLQLGQWESIISAVLPSVVGAISSAAGVKSAAVQEAEAVKAAQQAAQAAAEAQAKAAQAQAVAAQQRALLLQQETGGTIIPGIPNIVTIIGGLVVVGGIGYVVLKK